MQPRISDEEAQRMKEQAAQNRSQRRAQERRKNAMNPEHGTTKKGIMDVLKDLGEKGRQASQQQQGPEFEIPMPNSQTIEKDIIRWEWFADFFIVSAIWYKDTKTYIVKAGQLSGAANPIDGVEEDVWVLTGEQAKRRGEILCAAYKWESEWQENAGVYLANDGQLPEAPRVEFYGDDGLEALNATD